MSQRRRGHTNTRASLPAIYRLLHARYGPQHWWPAETPLEMIVGAILTQSAAWTNVEKAIANLKSGGALGLPALQEIGQEELARLIYPSGYYNVKAAKVKAFVSWLSERHGGDLDRLLALETAALRRDLLTVHGVGQETADSIILYAAHQPLFVVDAYTRRIVSRLGLAPREDTYQAFQALFMEGLPHDEALFNEYHALLVHHGKSVCRKKPLCAGCCLQAACCAAIGG